ncbi:MULTISPECIES: hypothetical protein [unclassified Lactococcus]|uniref:hypothetical protein n=1 Tax=unclassified Lactococcus TaxID=2643510 RepID=UPI0011C7EAAF|nr:MULTISPECIES: hypothetical protein [unclassified Lactococcus]MQW22979.1 hypothetical protein [Lactococcus sp. dk101]TXK44327.1 hypothetical protein FVP42_05090 [Lactococcus sp. dk310]TXK50136.1 hypothetical protein FVP43_05060 [Lactococcus sp. dk322]
MRSISIAESGNDSISVYENAANFVTLLNYEDFAKLNKLKLAKQPGIYILIGNNKTRYVGQAVGQSLKMRILQHKEIWMENITKVIFFGRKNEEFSKDQADLLEANLISLYKENSSFIILNKTNGNSSPIGLNAQLSAEEFLDSVFDILYNVANIDLFDDSQEVIDEISDKDLFVNFDGKQLVDSSARNLQVKFIESLLSNEKYNTKLRNLAVIDKATAKNNLGTKENVFPSGQLATKQLEPNLYLYVNLSKKGTSTAIKKIANWLDLAIQINF